jgi:hypothetical protein
VVFPPFENIFFKRSENRLSAATCMYEKAALKHSAFDICGFSRAVPLILNSKEPLAAFPNNGLKSTEIDDLTKRWIRGIWKP